MNRIYGKFDITGATMEGFPMIRPIEPSDISKGFFEVLSQLTVAPPLSRDKFNSIINQQRQSDLQRTVVVVNSDDRIVGTGSVFIEPKFVHGGRPCAHIEDIVVDKDLRGASVGKKLIGYLVQFARDRGCYKVILDCAEQNVEFYRKCGFECRELQMVIYFTDGNKQ